MGAYESYQVDALVDINPDTINLKSNGQWVTAYITLPDGLNVADIDVNTIRISSIVGVSEQACDYVQPADIDGYTPQVGDYDEDGIDDLTVKFDRQLLHEALFLDDNAITIEGDLSTGEHFSGSDTIRVIDRGKK